jgi:hypothetical protein
MTYMDKICAYCHTTNPSVHMYCFHCGESLDTIPTTKVITPDFQHHTSSQLAERLVPDLENRITLVVGEQAEQIYFRAIQRLVLGRCATSPMGEVTLDLSPYQGLELGVSRQHAIIIFRLNRFYLMDVGSRNGTYLNGKYLYSHQLTQLSHGDRIQLGQLRMYFYAQLEPFTTSRFPDGSESPDDQELKH